ncbi:Protein of unknown function DUF2628 [Syntrophomonas zehnderi OL-4]|uniref:Uncharacterized protein n=1 Tax=Syntrophomonas zehnderi OL-4 TaxID=690567 RepID=A0A0E3W2R3_9FIRM|nr:hypothetical protein [Syntrophomonas zehnderi]CFX15485.1 Protein of unknown function DUF2628 [Syntrophomonas zehnderi OL-4]
MCFVTYENPRNGKRTRVKRGFNWLVMGFGPLWFLFNGMILCALLWLTAAMVVGLLTAGIGGLLMWPFAGFFANGQRERRLIKRGWRTV